MTTVAEGVTDDDDDDDDKTTHTFFNLIHLEYINKK